MKRIVLIYPSARPAQVQGAIERARKTATGKVEVAIGLNGDSSVVPPIKDSVLIDFGPDVEMPGFIPATNLTYRLAVDCFAVSENELVGFWSDDFYPESNWDGTLYAALKAAPNKSFLSSNSGLTNCAVAPFATRKWWDECNGCCIWPTIYQRFSCDVDNTQRAIVSGAFQFVTDSVIKHRHHAHGLREADEIDKFGAQYYAADRILQEKRLAVICGNKDCTVYW